MSELTEAQLRLELAAANLKLAETQLQCNLQQQQHLALANSVQATLHYLTLPGASADAPHFQELALLLNLLATADIARIRLLQNLSPASVADPYDLRALQTDPLLPTDHETGREREE